METFVENFFNSRVTHSVQCLSAQEEREKNMRSKGRRLLGSAFFMFQGFGIAGLPTVLLLLPFSYTATDDSYVNC